MRCIWQRSWKN